jgi:hypothetical protein
MIAALTHWECLGVVQTKLSRVVVRLQNFFAQHVSNHSFGAHVVGRGAVRADGDGLMLQPWPLLLQGSIQDWSVKGRVYKGALAIAHVAGDEQVGLQALAAQFMAQLV